MEKVLSPEERIRRAENIYYRRRLQTENRQTARVNVEAKNYSFFRKFLVQALICTAIYLVWYGIKTNNNMFVNDINNTIHHILEYDTDINKVYSYIKVENKTEENVIDVPEEATVETIAPVQKEPEQTEIVDSVSVVEEMPEEASSIDQMKDDAEYIKSNISIIKPLTGTITSRFGLRESDNPKVAGFHTGIDIAVNAGTVFTAAMEGTVALVSSVGDYR